MTGKLTADTMSRKPERGLLERSLAACGPKLFELARALPCGRYADRLVFYAQFLAKQNRLPRRGGGYLDFIFYLKRDDRLSGDLQVLTTDKEFAKLFIAASIGQQHVVSHHAVLRTEDDINAYDFPDRCFIKGTAASGLVLTHEAGSIDRRALRDWLSISHYTYTREQNYRPLTPKIIVEPYIFGTSYNPDIQFYTYRGRVKFITYTQKMPAVASRAYDRQWRDLRFSITKPLLDGKSPRPVLLDEMVGAAEVIGRHFEFVRVDMYTNDREFLVGEITHCPGSSDSIFRPPEAEKTVNTLMFGEQT
jgi:teichuronopeptide biosynthesis TupA-like protein